MLSKSAKLNGFQVFCCYWYKKSHIHYLVLKVLKEKERKKWKEKEMEWNVLEERIHHIKIINYLKQKDNCLK